MAKLTKRDAARQLGISRTTLYKLIDQGRLSATPDGMIDETELVRVAPYVDTLREHTRTRVNMVGSAEMDTVRVCMNMDMDMSAHLSMNRRGQACPRWWTSSVNSFRCYVKNCRKRAQRPRNGNETTGSILRA